MPAEGIGEHAAEQDADATAARSDETETPMALARSAGSGKRLIINESATADTVAPPMP